MATDTDTGARCEFPVAAVLALGWTLMTRWLTTLRRWLHRATVWVADRGQEFDVQRRCTPATAAVPMRSRMATAAPGLSTLTMCAGERGVQRLAAGVRVLTSTVTAMVVLVALTGLVTASAPTPTPTPAAGQAGSGGVCETPAVDLFEWAARTGAGVLFLGGLLYGGYKHARAMLTPDPERASLHRRTGTMSMLAGPMFGLVIVFGNQAAGAVGFDVAQCAQLLPWF